MNNPSQDDTEDLQDFDDRPSKSQIKREMHALLDLGKRLIDQPVDRLKQLPLSERLYESIVLAQRTTSREGRRRQTHFVGKLMREADAATIEAQLETWANGSREETALMHRMEQWRDRLLADDEALTQFLSKFPATDVQALRAQIRAARKEAQVNATLTEGSEPRRKQYRALFQSIKTLIANQDAEDPND